MPSTEPPPAQPSTDRPRRVIKRYSNRKLYDTRDSRYVTLAQIAEFVRAGEEVQVIDNATKEDKTEATLALIISEEVKATPKAVPLSTLRDLVHQRSERLLSTLREGPIGRLIGGGEHADAPASASDATISGAASPGGAGGAQASNASATTVMSSSSSSSAAAPGQVAANVAASSSSPASSNGAAGSAPGAVAQPPPPSPSRTRLEELVESSKKTIDQWQAAIDERIRASLPAFLPTVVRDLEGDGRKLSLRADELERLQQLTRRVDELEARVRELGGQASQEKIPTTE